MVAKARAATGQVIESICNPKSLHKLWAAIWHIEEGQQGASWLSRCNLSDSVSGRLHPLFRPGALYLDPGDTNNVTADHRRHSFIALADNCPAQT